MNFEEMNDFGVLERFCIRYIDQAKLPCFQLMWNSLRDDVKRHCLPFQQAARLLRGRESENLYLHDEREGSLSRADWGEIVHFISGLEPWEENMDLLIFDEGLEWFLAVTHEDLLTIGNHITGKSRLSGELRGGSAFVCSANNQQYQGQDQEDRADPLGGPGQFGIHSFGLVLGQEGVCNAANGAREAGALAGLEQNSQNNAQAAEEL